MQTATRDPAALEAALEEIGFRRSRPLASLERNGLTAVISRDWCTLCRPAGTKTDPLRGQLGRRGLWRVVDRPGQRKKRIRVYEFDVPLSALSVTPLEWDDEPEDPVASLIDWAESTASEAAEADDVQPPAEDESTAALRQSIEAWLEPEGMTVKTGPFVRQTGLVCGPHRVALRCPILPRWPQTPLSQPRQQWLEKVLGAGQRQWRMVRIGMGHGENNAAVTAEIDLSGAPDCALEPLIRSGRDALNSLVSWLVWPVGLLSEPGVTCRAWETSPQRD